MGEEAACSTGIAPVSTDKLALPGGYDGATRCFCRSDDEEYEYAY
jgi:hypothetical protein